MGWMTGVQFLAGAGIVSLSRHVQTSTGAYPAFCTMDIRGSFPRSKVART